MRMCIAVLVLFALPLLPRAGVSQAATEVEPLSELVPDYMEGELETAVTPTPRTATLGDKAFAAGKVLVVKPRGYDAPDTIVQELKALIGSNNVSSVVGPDIGAQGADTLILLGRNAAPAWHAAVTAHGLKEELDAAAAAGPDAYVLLTEAGADQVRNVVLLAGSTTAADFWAFATLRQMIFHRNGEAFIREGRVLDFPRFALRGNKRPKDWEWRYKANYQWSFTRNDARFRTGGAWIHYGNKMEATDEEMDRLVEGYDYTDKQGRERRFSGARDAYANGCREFVIKFDDAGWNLSEAAQAKWGGGNPYYDYFEALNYYMNGLHRRIKAIDPANAVFFMPRPYWYNSFELPEFTAELLEHGPLPADMGLSVCGPEVISWSIPTDAMRDYRELLGLKQPAQIYDNFCRGGEYHAYTGRDRDLWQEVACVFNERGTPVSRITVYDYLWNPEAYDPERALKLALRELSGRDPELYAAMLDYVTYYNEHRWFAPYPSQERARAELPLRCAALEEKFARLRPLLQRSALARETDLEFEFWGVPEPRSSYEWGEYARLRRFIEFAPYMGAYGFRRGKVKRTDAALEVDGRLDEAAWDAAAPLPAFVKQAWGRKEPPTDLAEFLIPAEESTWMAMLYSDTHLYVGARFNYTSKPDLPSYLEKIWPDKKPYEQVFFAWRAPCFELLLDSTGKRENYRHIVLNIAHLWMATLNREAEPRQTGGFWQPEVTFRYSLGDTSGSLEVAIPLADLAAEPPRPGTIWGCQIFRSRIGEFQVFTGMCDLVGGEHGTREFGTLQFE